MRIEARPENVAIVRRALEAVVRRLAPDSPEIAGDVNVTVTEACMNAIRHGYPGGGGGVVDVEASHDGDRLEIAVRDYGVGISPGGSRAPGAGLGLSLIGSLADGLEIGTAPGRGTEVRLVFKLGRRRGAPATLRASSELPAGLRGSPG
jgi:serine/threonine-protein kinase RsbW